MKKLCILLICLLSGCATSPMNDMGVIAAFSARLSNIEKKLDTAPPKAMEEETRTGSNSLSPAQKEFMLLMMDYLSED